jgi:predicted DNA-binding protein (UPF0278 family)
MVRKLKTKTAAIPPLPKCDIDKILDMLAEFRRTIPFMEPQARRKEDTFDGRASMSPDSMNAFEWEVAAEALEDFSADLRASIERARAQAMDAAMKAYYTLEEAMNDPEQAETLRPQVEAMRKAYQEFYGKPIPPNPDKK